MGNCRSKKRKIFHFLGIFTLLLAFCVPAYAGVQEADGEYEVYPTPQNMVYGNGTTALTDQVDVTFGEGIDTYTRDRVDVVLEAHDLTKSTSAAADHLKLTVGIYGSNDAADVYGKSHEVNAAVYEEFDAYTLWISGKDVVILGKNTDAAYYGVTTFKRILEQLKDRNIRELKIEDYADIEFRGFIEGYYGNPWSHEDRIDLMKFGGEIKMNQYVFAPKDDPYHNKRWRDLYPTEEDPDGSDLTDIAALAQAGNESKCFFVYALHPFQNSPLTEANYASDLVVLKAKFKQVIDAGVRQIAILEDDASANGRWSATTLSRLLTDVTNWLKEIKATEYPDLKTDLLFCPGWMAYANSMTNSNDGDVQKIKAIHNGSPDEISIVMTGGKVWGEVNDTFSDNFYARMAETEKGGKYPYLWVNWPCNDNTKTSQIMGGHNYILHEGVDRSKYEGIIFNPIQESEPSKVGIFTGADYCWKIWQDEAEGDQAWDDSFKYIDHMTPNESEASSALREVARHMITQSPTQPQVWFEESLNIKDEILEFRSKMETGAVQISEAESLIEEFELIRQSADYYMESGENQRMSRQMTPFLSCLRDMTQADVYLLEAIKAVLSGDGGTAYSKFAEAQMAYEQSKTYAFQYYDSGNPPTYQMTIYAMAGRRYIIPFTEAVMEYVSDEIKSIIDPENIPYEEKLIFQVGGSTSASSVEGTKENAMDGNLNSVYFIKTNQILGDYVGMTFSLPVKVNNIKLYLGKTGNENDFIAEGVMEYTEDGKLWKAFDADLQPASGPEVSMEFSKPVELKGFRWKCTGFGERPNRWLAIRDLGYNVKDQQDTGEEKYTATFSRTSGWKLASASGPETNMTDGDENSAVWYDPSTEKKDTSIVGDYIQIDLGSAKSVGRVRALVGNGDGDKWTKYHVEYSATGNDGDWESLPSYTSTKTRDDYEVNLGGKEARYIRLVNDQEVGVWVKFREFAAYSYVDLGPVLEGDVMDYTNTKDAGWRVEYDEDISRVIPKEDATLKPGEYIGLKLNRIRALTNISVSGTGTEKLTLEKSVNRSEWTRADESGMARYIRLMNQSSQPVSFRLDSFTVRSDEVQVLTNIEGEDNAQDARYLGTIRNWTDGDVSTAAKFCGVPDENSYIIYDLGKEISVSSLKLWVNKDSLDYPRDVKVQLGTSSDENASWQEVLVIGDGQADTNTSSTKPIDNGWTPGEGAVGVAYASREASIASPVRARYIRFQFTAENAARWMELTEIEINGGEEYFPSVNTPALETDAEMMRGYEIQNINDGNFMTAFQPAGDENQSGYLIYHLSDTLDVGRINILQSGNSISNASVSVRTGSDTWKPLGKLDQGLCTFDTTNLDAVYAVKVEWNGKKPVIYEIATLLGPKLDAALNKADAADQAILTAENTLNGMKSQIESAQAKVNSATNAADKLRAEAALQDLYAKQAAAEASLAEKKIEAAELKSLVSRLEAENLRVQAKNYTAAENKAELESGALQMDTNAEEELSIIEEQRTIAATKKKEQETYAKAAANKQKELEEELKKNQNQNQNGGNNGTAAIKAFESKNLKYEVLDASKKTVAVAGFADAKKAKASLTIPNTVKSSDNTVWNVVKIKDKAFAKNNKITKVTVGSKVTSIGKQAFSKCKKLKTINLKKASKITSIGKKAFEKISAKAKFTVPAKKLGKYKTMLKKAGMPKKATVKK